ncbi:MAG: helix-turn-helix domain-containing protein [Bacillota bacterium]|nr:helix-turn-helix domain-containing protein [Bacillota bacterium]
MIDNQLLEKIKVLNHTFLQPDSRAPSLNEGLQAVADITGSAALLVDNEGKVLASNLGDVQPANYLKKLILEETIASDRGFMFMIKSADSQYNKTYPEEMTSTGEAKADPAVSKELYTVIPISGRVKPAANLFLFRGKEPLNDREVLLAEIGATLLGMLLRQEAYDQEDEESRNRELAEGAFESLSYSEVEAIQEILKNINNNESIVVASKIADRLGITRSVIVNALRKFESAGIIESRSLGMKGTFIRVKNLHALEMIASRSSRMGHFS